MTFILFIDNENKNKNNLFLVIRDKRETLNYLRSDLTFNKLLFFYLVSYVKTKKYDKYQIEKQRKLKTKEEQDKNLER